MPDRNAAEIRQEMAVERERLEESREALIAELRSFKPVVVVAAAAVGLIVASKVVRGGFRLVRKLT